MAELSTTFDPDKVSKSEAKFDSQELQSLNEKLLHAMPYDMAKPRLEALAADLGDAFWLAVRPNLARFDDVQVWADVVRGNFEPLPAAEEDLEFLAEATALLPSEPWSGSVWQEWTGALKAKTGRKGRGLFMPLRKALTGKEHGPDLGDLLPVIGPERTRRRLP
jgi:glutamyl-tRNA synthetase